MEDIVIVSAARTAVGKFGGSLAKTRPPELGAIVIKEAWPAPSWTRPRWVK
jgi:acetyl-CoA C-acetyltransferase